jgi:hypothetical protein
MELLYRLQNTTITIPMPQLRTALAIVVLFTSLSANAKDHYLFALFRDPGSSGVFFATSEDGYHWTEANNGKPVVKPAHSDELMRDPFLAKDPDGIYHIVWTWGWLGARMGHASSKDLVHWSSQDDIPGDGRRERGEKCVGFRNRLE